MPDKYRNFKQLAEHERLDADYSIQVLDRQSDCLIMAPHGGGIEPGTTEVTLALADTTYSAYTFDGLKAARNGDLHITSAKFDEPQALAMAGRARRIVTLHGEGSNQETIFMGGGNLELMAAIQSSLEKSGFRTATHSSMELQGKSPKNICNRCPEKGVQLELSRGLRASLFQSLSRAGRKRTTDRFHNLIRAMRQALDNKKKPSDK